LPLLAFLAGGARAEETSFRIHDQRDPAEIDEVTRVYIDGAHVGTFRLGPDREHDMLTVTVVPAPQHRYALCGQVTLRRPDGSVITREVNGAGTITDVAGREYDAVAANDFTAFYLHDITPGRAPAETRPIPQRGCSPVVG
jgi:hypothetical protein